MFQIQRLEKKPVKIIPKEDVLQTLYEHRDILKNRFKIKKLGIVPTYGKETKATKLGDIDLHAEFEDYDYDLFMEAIYYLEDLFDRQVDLIMPRTIKSHVKPYKVNGVTFVEGF